MKRSLPGAVLLVFAAAVHAQAPEPIVTPAAGAAGAPAKAVAKPAEPKVAAKAAGVTPNAERIVSIGAINKRTGETRTFVGRPGQMFDFGNLQVRVRTCEVTPPWEQKLTGAFLLIDERLARGGAKRVFSGWMFGESPSLHPLEHPLYDIWVKSCTMRFPDTGPDTVVAGKGDGGPSKAKKSAETSKAATN